MASDAGDLPKYARWEIERRFLVDRARLPELDAATERRIDDLYLDGGRLRLRKLTWAADDRCEFKLCKKYEGVDAVQAPITNLYLTAEEHAALAHLPGRRLTKRRFSLSPFGVDLFEDGLTLAEVEGRTRNDVDVLPMTPGWIVRDVTTEPEFTGWALAGR